MYRHKGSLGLPMFGSIQRVVLPADGRKTLSSSRFHALKNTILTSVKTVRKRRSASKTLYSAYHLNAFFESALRHVATHASSPFSFILATRECNPIQDRLWLCLRDFLRLCAANHTSQEATLEYMASALMLDSLPPGMHRKYATLEPPCFRSDRQASNRRRFSSLYTNLTATEPFRRCRLSKASRQQLCVHS
jgi:hypothetical protein